MDIEILSAVGKDVLELTDYTDKIEKSSLKTDFHLAASETHR